MYHEDRALALNPNDDLIVVQQGEILTWLGRPEEGIDWIKKAMRLNPYHPERYWNHLGRAYFVARRYREAIEAFQHISAPDHLHLCVPCRVPCDDGRQGGGKGLCGAGTPAPAGVHRGNIPHGAALQERGDRNIIDRPC